MVALLDDSVSQTPRSRGPEETLEAVKPWLKKAGVSRLADLTGMDCIGIPVFASIRPDSASLAVDSGKGITKAHAKTSAAMEALERWALDEVPVETPAPEHKHGHSWDDRFPIIRGAHKGSSGNGSSWYPKSALSTDIVSGETVLVPYYCVKLYTDGDTLQDRVFSASTNGMASGNTREEAIASGIFEVVERDAVHLANLENRFKRFNVESSKDPFTNEALSKIRSAGCELFSYDCTGDVGIPVFLSLIVDREKGICLYKGYGCHLSPDIALNRSICEAAQARCLILAGARDDITWAHHRNLVARTYERDWVKFLDEPPSTRSQDMSDLSTGSVDGDINKAIAMLSSAGFERVLVVDFPIEDAPFSCVKVLIPKMAGYFYLAGVEYGRLEGRP